MSLRLVVNEWKKETPQLRVLKGGVALTQRLEDAPVKPEQPAVEHLPAKTSADSLKSCDRYYFDSKTEYTPSIDVDQFYFFPRQQRY